MVQDLKEFFPCMFFGPGTMSAVAQEMECGVGNHTFYGYFHSLIRMRILIPMDNSDRTCDTFSGSEKCSGPSQGDRFFPNL